MGQQTRLTFSPDETAAIIIFSDGMQSVPYISRRELITALEVLKECKRITVDDFDTLNNQAISAKNLLAVCLGGRNTGRIKVLSGPPTDQENLIRQNAENYFKSRSGITIIRKRNIRGF